ncbi:hypothetical protein DITRI_Ditri12bG0166300 [Diplodiscus trichospermus]
MASPRLRTLTWWRKWAKRDWAVAAVGFTIIIFTLTYVLDSRFSDSSSTFYLHSADDLVPLTLLRGAKATGAFCLDGSLPGYHFQKGFGSGSNNWLLHIEGGGWCNSIKTCNSRKGTALGSSNYMERQVTFSGILSRHPSQNPDFYNWNIVKIRYCDGASLAGHPESEFKNGTKLFFRGQLIWEAIMNELLSLGLSNAKQALLSGCSAGGLATLIHCDDFRDHLPKDATVKCLADAGFFLDEPDILGNHTMSAFYHDVVELQGVAKSLQKDCVRRMEPSKCIFPREIIKNVRTSLFIVNPAYDFWQIQNILVPVASDPRGYWSSCRLNIQKCDSTQIKILQGFRGSLLEALSEFKENKEGGMFINSCFIHCQTLMTETWHSPNSPRINNKSQWVIGTSTAKYRSRLTALIHAIPRAITWTSHEVNEARLRFRDVHLLTLLAVWLLEMGYGKIQIKETKPKSSRFARQFLPAMGKRMRQKTAGISIPLAHPGCMWGILHGLKYQRWHWRFIKKRLPRSKHDVGAENSGVSMEASSANDWSNYRNAEVANSEVEGKKRKSGAATKNSVRSRLKALITEEVSKRKGQCRHKRSSTYPARSQLTGTGSTHHAEAHIDDLLPEIALNDESLRAPDKKNNNISSDSSSEDQVLLKSLEEPITSDENGGERGMVSDVCFPEQKSPHHESAEDICRKSMPLIAADHRAGGIRKLYQSKAEMAYISSSGSSQHLKQSGGNQVARKRFKHLKQNIKHAIKESKKERHRIAMDAVLHKIPHKKGFSKDLTKDIVDHFKNPSKIRDVFSDFSSSKRKIQRDRRASSFNESMDRYTQLYESSINREPKEHISERTPERREEMVLPNKRSAPKCLGRILSSPELHSYFYQSDSSDAFSLDMPTTVADSTLSISSLNEQKSDSEALDYRSQDTLGKSESEENMIGIRETLDESGNLMMRDNVSQSPIPSLDFSFEGQAASPTEIPNSQEADLELKLSQGLPNELRIFADMQHELRYTPKVAEGMAEFEKVEALKKDLDTDLLKDPVDTNDKDKFNYVRDVLELSGFSGNEALGTWHADDQPLDPVVYDEAIRGCIFCDPRCSGVEEVTYCNHPLLFDLINEVLLELYERSYSYCPIILSSLCHIRAMPVGQNVVNEVWANISWYLSYESGFDKPLDYVSCRDLARSDGWMNLQFENECLGLELEELIFDDLLEELM